MTVGGSSIINDFKNNGNKEPGLSNIHLTVDIVKTCNQLGINLLKLNNKH